MMLATFPCPRCQRPWPLTEHTLGQVTKCACGHTFTLPVALPVVPIEPDRPLAPDFFRQQTATFDDPLPVVQESEPEVFQASELEPLEPVALADPTPPASVRARPMDADAVELAPAPVVPMKPGQRATPFPRAIGYQTRKAVPADRAVALVLGSPVRDFYVPLALTIIGALLYYARNILYDPKHWQHGLIEASAQMLLNGMVTVCVIALLGRVTDMDLGTATGTVMKVAALAVFPNAVAGMFLLGGGGFCGLVGGGTLGVCLNYTLFKSLFDLELTPAFLATMVTTIMTLMTWSAILFFM